MPIKVIVIHKANRMKCKFSHYLDWENWEIHGLSFLL